MSSAEVLMVKYNCLERSIDDEGYGSKVEWLGWVYQMFLSIMSTAASQPGVWSVEQIDLFGPLVSAR